MHTGPGTRRSVGHYAAAPRRSVLAELQQSVALGPHPWRYRAQPLDARQKHQPPVQIEQLSRRRQQGVQAEELRTAVQPRIVVNAHFHHCAAAQLNAAHQFHADASRIRPEIERLEDAAPYQPEVAIDVAQSDSAQRPRKAVIEPSDTDPVPWIVSR